LRNGTKAPGKKILVALDLRAGAVLKWSESIKFGGSLEGPSENSAGETSNVFSIEKMGFYHELSCGFVFSDCPQRLHHRWLNQ